MKLLIVAIMLGIIGAALHNTVFFEDGSFAVNNTSVTGCIRWASCND